MTFSCKAAITLYPSIICQETGLASILHFSSNSIFTFSSLQFIAQDTAVRGQTDNIMWLL